jgi:hypothetical protein
MALEFSYRHPTSAGALDGLSHKSPTLPRHSFLYILWLARIRGAGVRLLLFAAQY